jgi:ABC-type sulfate transport system permease subunit
LQLWGEKRASRVVLVGPLPRASPRCRAGCVAAGSVTSVSSSGSATTTTLPLVAARAAADRKQISEFGLVSLACVMPLVVMLQAVTIPPRR